jgi:Phytanoyl-CoA dioxygenase (PhyH)
MARMSEAKIKAGFERIEALRRLERHREQYLEPEYWRTLNPELSITSSPFVKVPPVSIAADEAASHARQLREEGYLKTRPLVPIERCERLARAVTKLAELQAPTVFASLYDEYYQIFQGLESLFNPILGEGYQWVGHGNYAYYVPPGDSGSSGLTAAAPHRDTLGPDAPILKRELPTIVSLWVPLTDVSPDESCIYVVPADLDPDYFTGNREIDRTQLDLQTIRALPTEAGSVVAWSTHLIHWGSAASRRARHPRMSVTMYFQRSDIPPFNAAATFKCGDEVPFHKRLRWAAQSLGLPGFFD